MEWECIVPNGVCGNWRVESFIVSADASEATKFRAAITGRPGEYVPKGDYKRLRRGSVTIMSNTPMEANTNREFVQRAQGNVLISGLGLGLVLNAILKKPEITLVTVIEKYAEVITLVWPSFESDPRCHIVHADALEYRPPRGAYYDAVWHDIWDSINPGNLPEMTCLHRRYARRCGWQGSWAKKLCQDARSRCC